MFAVDIASFGTRRDPAVQRHLRSTIHRIVRDSCHTVGMRLDKCHIEDRGDGLFVIANPETSIEDLLGPLVTQLLSGVREHNKLANGLAQIHLRVAVHAGYVHLDQHGATGTALIHLFRLLDAAPFKAELTASAGDFALIVSHYLYEEVIAYSVGVIGAAVFQPVTIQVKETYDRGWVWLPPGHAATVRLTVTTADRSRVNGTDTALLTVLTELTATLSRSMDAAPSVLPPADARGALPNEIVALLCQLLDGRATGITPDQARALLIALRQIAGPRATGSEQDSPGSDLP